MIRVKYFRYPKAFYLHWSAHIVLDENNIEKVYIMIIKWLNCLADIFWEMHSFYEIAGYMRKRQKAIRSKALLYFFNFGNYFHEFASK